ncbi:MAG: peptide chain release factor N(5)-glutamine methyltransferase [Thermodesulfobacteriota bacterium]|nr:peptide chain release factor N(5)-glutamine methyltransferase [Thermodesulfobacteriota bacterium]
MQTWTIRSILAWAKGYLSDKGMDTPRLDAELLLASALDTDRIHLYMDIDRPLVSGELKAFRLLLKRRLKREPVAYILGQKEFFGRSFIVDKGIFIPRPETEILVGEAIGLTPRDSTVLEIGVGSGAVVVSILLERPDIKAIGCDISKPSVLTAKENARTYGVDSRLRLFVGDLFSPISSKFPVIVVNPPYVALKDAPLIEDDVIKYEAGEALFAGHDGIDIIKRVLEGITEWLCVKGLLIMEVGYNQKDAIEGYIDIMYKPLVIKKWIRDISGIERVIVLEKICG